MCRYGRSLLWAALLVAGPLGAGEERGALSPDYAVSQFAGSIGYLSLGAGKRFPARRLEAELLLGYAPAMVAGEDLYAAALKGRYLYPPLEAGGGRFTPYVGMGLNYYIGDKFKVSGSYPSDYYPYSQWHLMPHVGVRLRPLVSQPGQPSLSLEAGMLDTYLIHYYNNHDYLNLSEVVSVSLALQFPLH